MEAQIPNYEEDIGVDLVPASQSKPNRQRKSTAGTRKVTYSWSEEEIFRLISSVEQHRGLWDVSAAEYKLSKLDAWRIVADELAINGVDSTEAKMKWLSLRTTFMTNLAALRKKKSGQGANESHNVSWKFFKSMMFLEANNLEQSTSSTSTLHLVILISFIRNFFHILIELFFRGRHPLSAIEILWTSFWICRSRQHLKVVSTILISLRQRLR